MISNNYRKLPVYTGNFPFRKLWLCLIIVVLLSLNCACKSKVFRNVEEVTTNKSISSDLPTVNVIKNYSGKKMDWWKNGEYREAFFYDAPLPSKRQITIAVIDTGISASMLRNSKIYTNKNEIANNIDDDGNGYIDDINGWNFVDNNNDVINYNKNSVHASAIMGLLIGEDREDAYYGLLNDYNIKVVPIKSLDDNTLSGSVDAVIDGIEYAETIEADIVALSFSTYTKSEKLEKAIRNSKMLFVVAAGNEGRQLGDNYKVYPACFRSENIISVTALGQDGCIDELSNYGASYVDVAAPGIDIMCYLDNKKYVLKNGTSFSVPFVVYAASILECISENKLSPRKIKEIICDTVSENKDNLIHEGTINISKAINYLQENGL